MIKRLNTTEADWLKQNVEPFETSKVTIGNIMPEIFESYAKVFHPFEIADCNHELNTNNKYGRSVDLIIEKNEGLSLYERTSDGQIINVYDRYRKEQEGWLAKPRRVATWKEVAEKYEIRYHNEINLKSFINKFQEIGWPNNLGFPSEGFLPRNSLLMLIEDLKRHTFSSQIFIYQEAPNTIWKDDLAEDLIASNFAEVAQYFKEDFIGYLYDENKNWLVHTNTDLPFTIVSGSSELISSLESSQLEVLPCLLSTRIDEIKDY